ncbi:hypothetical protein IPC102_09495 [Pseudomonas aeruginosa]|uniref:hypothetical protein n=1 Tax=Pseudomonas aeruginosa TaxID=287 RepID=UPI000F52D074|nr:hypothetical protein [Pseudomonas aeruginosa]RQH69995.1 hypothetical protein IPC102_09495 [Pseudomonas aeruginosa]
MNNIVEFPQKGERQATGDAICARCRHEWVAVAPVGAVQLECPACQTHHGLFKYPFGPSKSDSTYVCNCGSDLYFILKRKGQEVASVICRGCGQEATGWFD